MYYDLRCEMQKRRAEEKIERLAQLGSLIDITEVKGRTLEQNSYYQFLVSYFCSRTGYDTEYVKEHLLKRVVCKDIFIKKGIVRSSSNLSSEEMQTVISRFQYWSMEVAGIYLPESNNLRHVAEAMFEIREDRAFIQQPELKFIK